MMDNIISSFMNRTYENEINKKMLYYDYVLPKEEIELYIKKILETPIEKMLEHVFNVSTTEAISARDVLQFSDFTDGTEKICKKIISVDNPGLTYLEAGKLLFDDGVVRTDTAYNKYGENHLKLSAALGLTYELTHVYFVSCIGYAYVEMNETDKQRLTVRLLIRNKLISRLLKASNIATVDMRQFLYMLSDSTYIRRRSNIKYVLNLLSASDEYDFSQLISKINIK